MKKILFCMIALCLCACDSAEKKKPAKEIPIEQTVAKPKKERKKEPYELREGYSSTEGFKFGTSYDEAKRIVEEEVGEVELEFEDDLYFGDKHFGVIFINTIDSLDISGINFYFQNDELYGIKAETWFQQDVKHYLTERLGKPYNMNGKRIWIVNKGNDLYYLSSEQDVIEYIKIK